MATGYLTLSETGQTVYAEHGKSATGIITVTVPQSMIGATFTDVSLSYTVSSVPSGCVMRIRSHPYVGDSIAYNTNSTNNIVGNNIILQKLVDGQTQFQLGFVLQNNNTYANKSASWNNVSISVTYTSAAPSTTSNPVISSITWSDSTSYYSTYSGYVQNKSRLTCSFNVTLDTATDPNVVVVSRKLTINGNIYQSDSNSISIGTIDSSGDGNNRIYYTIEVTDNHGSVGFTSGTDYITIVPYAQPKLTSIVLKRYTSYPSTPSASGTIIGMSVSGSMQSYIKNTSNQWSIDVSITNGSTTRSRSSILSGSSSTISGNARVTRSGYTDTFSASYDWDVTVTLSDNISSVVYTQVVRKNAPIFNIEENGVSVGTGFNSSQYTNGSSLQCDGMIYANNSNTGTSDYALYVNGRSRFETGAMNVYSQANLMGTTYIYVPRIRLNDGDNSGDTTNYHIVLAPAGTSSGTAGYITIVPES